MVFKAQGAFRLPDVDILGFTELDFTIPAPVGFIKNGGFTLVLW